MTMTKKLKTLYIMLFLTLTTTLQTALAQPPPPGNQSNGLSTSGDPIGGGAPIGSGEIFLLLMAAMYGGKKVYNYKTKEAKEL